MKKVLSLITVALFVCTVTIAQKLTQGKIVYGIEWESSEMNDDMKAMLPTESVLYFKDKKSRMEMSMGMMGDNISISDGGKNETITYMNMMGNKMGIRTTAADVEKMRGGDKPKVTKTAETKTIAGYKCNQAIIETKGQKFEMWYSKDIDAANNPTNTYEGIDGFLMQFTIDQKGMLMKMTCKSVEGQSIGDDMFTPLTGYEIMTAEEMQKKFKQGGGEK